MESAETTWKSRYYELESTLEQMLLGFEKVLSNLELKHAQITQPALEIYKIARIHIAGREALCCIANGINMQYQFDFFAGKTLIEQASYQHSNTALIPINHPKPTRCKVSAKSSAGPKPQVVVKEINL